MSDPVVHFEMPYKDAKRLSDFYNKTFGWDMHNAGESLGNYVAAGTTATNDKGMVSEAGAINGGFYPINPAAPYPSVVISVNDVQETVDAIKKNGGSIGETTEIRGVGTYVSFTDTEGNRVSILHAEQPEEHKSD